MVLALFVFLELFTNLVLETVLYAGAVGVSQVKLLVSVAFWTWLWGRWRTRAPNRSWTRAPITSPLC